MKQVKEEIDQLGLNELYKTVDTKKSDQKQWN